MMRQLTVLTKSVASFHDPQIHRNPYGSKPYWNNNRRLEGDNNRWRPKYPEIYEKKNVNWCDETQEQPFDTSYPNDQPININLINDLYFHDGFWRVLLE